jgi:hypothetical protein
MSGGAVGGPRSPGQLVLLHSVRSFPRCDSARLLLRDGLELAPTLRNPSLPRLTRPGDLHEPTDTILSAFGLCGK